MAQVSDLPPARKEEPKRDAGAASVPITKSSVPGPRPVDDLDELEDMLNDLEGGDSDDLDDLLDEIAPAYKPAPPRP